MVEIKVAYEGGLRCRAEHGPSSTELLTDAPVDNQGRGASYSPTDLVATAVGTCMMTIMGIYADRHELDLTGSRITIRKHMTTEPPRRIAKVEVHFEVTGQLNDRHREGLVRAAEACPVARSLHPDIVLDHRFEWLG